MILDPSKKIWVIAAVLLIGLFAGLFLHFHVEEHSHDCPVCRFISQLVLLLPAVLLLLAALKFRPAYARPVFITPLSRRNPAIPKTGPPRLF